MDRVDCVVADILADILADTDPALHAVKGRGNRRLAALLLRTRWCGTSFDGLRLFDIIEIMNSYVDTTVIAVIFWQSLGGNLEE